ncbi:hypothetical protein GSI_04454 [Ganoderma sinense ZZ0214-1]|uniref:F-box domain-containing protein n=1 Tax=Ganoderma sinense ZZ0214-1 TaxID=1077348 RepID=A0A2G8SGU2_9APHY|nr:hypothetical protein GSI_04454 [Ganoderma sinense ZZ0214-1]
MTHSITPILPHPELAFPLDKHDVAALNELSDASEVRAWTHRKVAKYKKYITALLAIHNSIAPIHKLPTEILQKIFSYVPSKSLLQPWCSASWVVSLQSVCRRWRSVLLATPEYWLQGLYATLNPYPKEDESTDSDDDDDDDDDDDESEDSHTYSRIRDLFLARSEPCPLELQAMYTSSTYSLGWKLFEDHFDRVTVFEIEVQDEDELYDVLDPIRTSMKRLEKLRLCIDSDSDLYPGEDLPLSQWTAENLPRLRQLQITAPLFSRSTTVPSLQKIALYGVRYMASLPDLLDALEGCPALASIQLDFEARDEEERRIGSQALGRVVDLPNLHSLEVGGKLPDLSLLLSCLSFPSTTELSIFVGSKIGGQFVLPSLLPRRISGLHAAPTIDHLYIHSEELPRRADPPQPDISMIGFVLGAMRLKVCRTCRFKRSADCLRFLEAFAACTVTKLVLNLGPLPDNMVGKFWTRFFEALPDVCRLELLSTTIQSRRTKRDVAKRYLASTRARGFQRTGHHDEITLVWVLRSDAHKLSHLEEELGDVLEVLSDHASRGGTLNRLELYVTTFPPHLNWSDGHDVARIVTDGAASRFVARNYVSRLSAVADVVTVGGGWRLFAENDGLDADLEDEDLESMDDSKDGDEEEEEEEEEEVEVEVESDGMQVV